MDPILKYLLEYNELNAIEFSTRLIIPPGGLQNMLDEFNHYHFNRVEVTKDELELPNEKWQKSQLEEHTLEELYDLID